MQKNNVRAAVSTIEPICLVERYLWRQIHEAAERFHVRPLTDEDKEDIYSHVSSVLIQVNKKFWEDPSYLMTVVDNQVESAIRQLRGRAMKDGTRKTDKFESLEALTPEENQQGEYSVSRDSRLLQENSSTHSNVEEALTLERVRARLSGRVLAVFDWVLTQSDKWHSKVLSQYCRERWGIKNEKTIVRYRQIIADAMHAEGMALAYPPPAGNARKMTPLQRRKWLLEIREQGHPTMDAAARANGIDHPSQLNYHCLRLFGKSFNEFNRKAA